MTSEQSIKNLSSTQLTKEETLIDTVAAAKKAKNQAKNDEKRQAKLEKLAAKQAKVRYKTYTITTVPKKKKTLHD